MTQEAIALRTTGDSYPGVAVVQDLNKALATVATDFAGPDDPAALAGPWMSWADTGNMLLKRRNAANSEWMAEGALLKAPLPQYAEADVPLIDKGDIHVIGKGTYTWQGSAYAPTNLTVSSIESTGTIKAAASTAANEVTVQSQVFGVEQTRQNVSGSRATGTNYTNLTGKVITVFISGLPSVANGYALGQVGADFCSSASHPTPSTPAAMNFDVPPGAVYRVIVSGFVLSTWYEYR